jgi:hypothetical protein
MNTSPVSESAVSNIIIQAFLNNSPDKGPKKDSEYRFYHCHNDWNGLKCTKVNGPSTMSTRDDSILLFVKSYIPERLDKHILKYKWIPNRVIIEEKST